MQLKRHRLGKSTSLAHISGNPKFLSVILVLDFMHPGFKSPPYLLSNPA